MKKASEEIDEKPSAFNSHKPGVFTQNLNLMQQFFPSLC